MAERRIDIVDHVDFPIVAMDEFELSGSVMPERPRGSIEFLGLDADQDEFDLGIAEYVFDEYYPGSSSSHFGALIHDVDTVLEVERALCPTEVPLPLTTIEDITIIDNLSSEADG